MFHTGTSEIGSPLLSLPLEIRLKIYSYTLDTGVIDPVTNSRVHVIKHRRQLRHVPLRHNNYCFVSANAKSGSLARVCAQIRDEIHTYLPQPTFKFVSPWAFADYLGWDAGVRLNQCTLSTLETAARVVVVIDGRIYGRLPLEYPLISSLVH
jgi:hypothetical protein